MYARLKYQKGSLADRWLLGGLSSASNKFELHGYLLFVLVPVTENALRPGRYTDLSGITL